MQKPHSRSSWLQCDEEKEAVEQLLEENEIEKEELLASEAALKAQLAATGQEKDALAKSLAKMG